MLHPLLVSLLLVIEPAIEPRSVAHDVAGLLDQGDVDGARARIESAYAANPDPRFVYMHAALEEHVGRCDRAVTLYVAFLEDTDDPLDREEAEAGLERCGAPVPSPQPQQPTPPPAAIETPPATDTTASEVIPLRKPWHQNPLGWTLIGVGAAAGAAGGALLVLADGSARAANDSGQQSSYEQARLRVRPWRTGGALALTAGSALMVAGIVRFIVVNGRKRNRTAHWGPRVRF